MLSGIFLDFAPRAKKKRKVISRDGGATFVVSSQAPRLLGPTRIRSLRCLSSTSSTDSIKTHSYLYLKLCVTPSLPIHFFFKVPLWPANYRFFIKPYITWHVYISTLRPLLSLPLNDRPIVFNSLDTHKAAQEDTQDFFLGRHRPAISSLCETEKKKRKNSGGNKKKNSWPVTAKL